MVIAQCGKPPSYNDMIKAPSTNMVYQIAPRMPAVALLQGNGNSFAVLEDSPFKCFLGEWIDHAPLCNDLTSEEVKQLPSCDCSDRWPSLETLERGDNEVLWRSQNMTYYEMIPSESMVALGVHQALTLEIFFRCLSFPVHNSIHTLVQHLMGCTQTTRPKFTPTAP